MLEINLGDVVVSIQGRDAGQKYIVSSINNEYVFLVNGKNRTFAKPKKKKIKHIRPTGQKCVSLYEKLLNKNKILDSEIRKTIDNLNII